MKKLMASLLVFTIGVGANGVYCNAVTEPTEKVDEKVTQTAVNENTEKAKSEENKANTMFQQRLKEIKISEEDRKKLNKKKLDKKKLLRDMIDISLSALALPGTIVRYIAEMFE